MRIAKLTVCVFACAVLAACQSGPRGVRVVNGGSSAIPEKQGQTQRDLDASEIGNAIVGKTFQYTRPDGNGFVTYNSDGSLDFQDDTKGPGRGRWNASGTQYCEVFGPSAPQECGVFKSTGDAYFAAKSRLVEMKV